MKKRLLTSLLATAIIIGVPINAHAEWKKDNTGWWYTEGKSYAKGWREIDGKWYYFYSSGYMARNTTIDGYYLNGDGQWISSSNSTSSTGVKNSTASSNDVTLSRSDFNNASENRTKNFIDYTKEKGYSYAYQIYWEDGKDEDFKTSKGIKLGDTILDIRKTYATQGIIRAIHSDEVSKQINSYDLCYNCPAWSKLQAMQAIDLTYIEDGQKYQLTFYLTMDNKVVMIAYFKNPQSFTKDDIKW